MEHGLRKMWNTWMTSILTLNSSTAVGWSYECRSGEVWRFALQRQRQAADFSCNQPRVTGTLFPPSGYWGSLTNAL